MQRLGKHHSSIGSRIVMIVIGYLCMLPVAYAQTELNVATIVKNFAETVPQLMLFTTAFAYVLGFFFVFYGVILLKKYGEARTQMSGEAKLAAPLLYLFVGAALIYLPSAVQSGLTTFWLEPTPYGYETESNDEWSEFIKACFMIIQLVGVIAFIRGLLLLTKLGGQGQPGSFGKAMAHIIGGIFCIDMYDFLQAVFQTFGLGELPF